MANLFPKKHSKEKKLKNVEDVVHILLQTCFQKNHFKEKKFKNVEDADITCVHCSHYF